MEDNAPKLPYFDISHLCHMSSFEDDLASIELKNFRHEFFGCGLSRAAVSNRIHIRVIVGVWCEQEMQTIVVRCGRLVDGTGRPPAENVAILIEAGRIAKIGAESAVKVSSEARVVDASDETVMPGLMDLHVHLDAVHIDPKKIDARGVLPEEPPDPAATALYAYRNARNMLEAGFTTVRNFAGHYGYAVKKAIEHGLFVGPRIFHGEWVSPTAGHGPITGDEADGVDEVRKRTRQRLKAGADWIKTPASGGAAGPGDWRRANYTLEELKAIVEEAHGAKRRVATHAHSRGVTLAVEAGIDDIEHGAEMEDRTIQMMKEKGTFYVPTLAVYAWMAQESWLPEPILSKSREITKEHIPSFKKALEAGVKIGLGTDNGMFIPHNQSAVELECLVKNGMTEMQAIVAATKTAAEVLGLEASLGTIQEGKIADLIVVNDNPLSNISMLRKPENILLVMKEEQIIVERLAGS